MLATLFDRNFEDWCDVQRDSRPAQRVELGLDQRRVVGVAVGARAQLPRALERSDCGRAIPPLDLDASELEQQAPAIALRGLAVEQPAGPRGGLVEARERAQGRDLDARVGDQQLALGPERTRRLGRGDARPRELQRCARLALVEGKAGAQPLAPARSSLTATRRSSSGS